MTNASWLARIAVATIYEGIPVPEIEGTPLKWLLQWGKHDSFPRWRIAKHFQTNLFSITALD